MLRNHKDTHARQGNEDARRKALGTRASKLITKIKNTPYLAKKFSEIQDHLVIIRDQQVKTASGEQLHRLENTVERIDKKIGNETGQQKSSKFSRDDLKEGLQ